MCFYNTPTHNHPETLQLAVPAPPPHTHTDKPVITTDLYEHPLTAE